MTKSRHSEQDGADVKQHLYKMADLVALTGVNKKTIQFYIGEGLLPAPRKTARNMAWYSDQHVELIKRIKMLQEELFLPLKAIKTVLLDTTDHKFTKGQTKFIANLKEQLDHEKSSSVPSRIDKAEVKKLVSEKDLKELQNLGWIDAKKPPFSKEDQEVINLWARFLKAGLNRVPGFAPAKLQYLLEAIDYMFDQGMAFHQASMSNMDQEEAAALVSQGHFLIAELFPILYKRRVRSWATRLLD